MSKADSTDVFENGSGGRVFAGTNGFSPLPDFISGVEVALGRDIGDLTGVHPVDLHDVLDGMTEGFSLLGPEFTILYLNAEALRLETRTREQIIGRSHWELYPGSEEGPLGLLYKVAMRDRVAVNLEHRHTWLDGRFSWLDIRAFPTADGNLAVFFRDVTERHDADQKLRESEARFRGAVEAFADVLWTNDAEGRMRGEQPGWAALTGQSYDEYQGYGWSKAVHPHDAQPTIDAWEIAVSERRPFVFEHRVCRHDGMWRRFSIRAVPIFDADGAIREWVGVHHDITEMRESEMRFRQLADNITALFYIHELGEKRISYVNKQYELIWQQPENALFADMRSFMRDIHAEDRVGVEAALQRQFNGESTETRYRLIQPDGTIRYIHDRSFVTIDPDTGAPRVVGIAEDVTITTEARMQLARNAETFEALVRDNPFGVCVVDSEFRLLEVSQGAKSTFDGITPLAGRDFAEILRIVWQDPFATDAIGHFRNTLATGEPYISIKTIDARDNADGIQAYDWRINRIVLPDGSFGVVCYFYDLSERMALEASLQQALTDKDVLLHEIDHRVRNSLSMVAALLSMQGGSSPSAEVKQALTVAASRMQAVARVHERLYKGKELGIVEFGAYLKEVCQDLRESLQRERVELIVKTIPIDLPVDHAIPLGLITNELITNAFKHCGSGGATIDVGLTLSDDNLLLTVTDTGDGMPADYDATVRKGLGMQVISLLTRQVGGTLTSPAAGGRATFSLAIPIALNSTQDR